MRAFIQTGLGIIFMLGMISLFTSCDKDDSSPRLSAEEESSLLFMLEEEKLARDVYLHMFRKYDQMVFDHISSIKSRLLSSSALSLGDESSLLHEVNKLIIPNMKMIPKPV